MQIVLVVLSPLKRRRPAAARCLSGVGKAQENFNKQSKFTSSPSNDDNGGERGEGGRGGCRCRSGRFALNCATKFPKGCHRQIGDQNCVGKGKWPLCCLPGILYISAMKLSSLWSGQRAAAAASPKPTR